MIIFKKYKKIITTSVLIITLAVVITYFDSFYAKYDFRALATYTVTKNDVANIPSNINFIQDDKKTFLQYYKTKTITNQPLLIDDKTYIYYGNRNGYRFYRMSTTAMSLEYINSQLVLGGYTFESPFSFKPSNSGFYIISDSKIFTLEEAYSKKIIDIKQMYLLYMAKNFIS
jgi:hypothetical protein